MDLPNIRRQITRDNWSRRGVWEYPLRSRYSNWMVSVASPKIRQKFLQGNVSPEKRHIELP